MKVHYLCLNYDTHEPIYTDGPEYDVVRVLCKSHAVGAENTTRKAREMTCNHCIRAYDRRLAVRPKFIL